MKRVFFIFIILGYLTTKANSQDAVFSQYYINSLHLNPAIAGSANEPRVFMHYRNQWPALGSTFVTYQASYDQYIRKINSGFGINVVRDNILSGVMSVTSLDLIYSYRFKATQALTMQAGLQGSLKFGGINSAGLNTSNPNNNVIVKSSAQPALALGILGMTRNTQMGFSITNISNERVKFNAETINIPIKFSLFFSRQFKVYNKYKVQDNGFYVTPAIMVQKQSSSIMINYGAGVRVNNFLAGLWMRTNLPMQFSAAIFSVGFAFNNITLGYSYDYNMLSLSKLMPVTGAHEFTLVAIFPQDPKRGRYGPIKCPSAFVQ